VRDHHKAKQKRLTESVLYQIWITFQWFIENKIDIHMKSESFKTLELTAELGTKLVDFLREPNKVNVTFRL
jgi:hypothetical protein